MAELNNNELMNLISRRDTESVRFDYFFVGITLASFSLSFGFRYDVPYPYSMLPILAWVYWLISSICGFYRLYGNIELINKSITLKMHNNRLDSLDEEIKQRKPKDSMLSNFKKGLEDDNIQILHKGYRIQKLSQLFKLVMHITFYTGSVIYFIFRILIVLKHY